MKSRPVSMVGRTAVMETLRARLERYAPLGAPVLLQGETGSGKDVAARFVHARSGRAGGSFVAVNCGALPTALVESELFGSVEGAFTGARRRRGLVTEAAGGTLFLDEIGDLPLMAQAALLRVLETGWVRPVGAESGHQVDFRVVSATHRDLPQAVAAGRFRADLYHRLSPLVARVPPLRERLEDLPELVAHLDPEAARRLDEAGWQALALHGWPGNVRELRNVLLRARADADGAIRPRHLGLSHRHPLAPPRARAWDGLALQDHVRRHVQRVLDLHGHNVRATARALGVSHNTIYRYLAPAQ